MWFFVVVGGGAGDRTHELRLVRQILVPLRYIRKAQACVLGRCGGTCVIPALEAGKS